MTKRVYNFGAGPAALPEQVLLEAQAELLDWRQMGLSILELGHRTPEFEGLLQQIEADLREILAIPQNYQVIFMGGAARTHFALAPMNYLEPNEQAAYLVSGVWSKMAFEEAARLYPAICLASSEADNFIDIPDFDPKTLPENAAYLYYTPNETVNGVRFAGLPDSAGRPLFADMTSCLLAEPIQISDYALIFAGAQKNIANAGLTLVIARDDLLARSRAKMLPAMSQYATQADQRSLYATPPVFNCYLAGKMLTWIKAQGGLAAMAASNEAKAAKLYQYLEGSDFYRLQVKTRARSLMNVCFDTADASITQDFLAAATAAGLVALKGHRLVGGLRASLYNAVSMQAVDALLNFLDDFAKTRYRG